MGRQADNSSEKRTLEPIIDAETVRRLWDEAMKATLDHVLETQLHDSRIPKPEIVHYASRKTKALEEEVERLREDARRYRWLRDEVLNSDLTYFGKIDRRAWDSEIDAAMEGNDGRATAIEKTMSHVEREVYENEISRMRREIETLSKCCTQRGARMQIMRDWMDSGRGIGPPSEWWYFCEERPEAKNWFDEDGAPK